MWGKRMKKILAAVVASLLSLEAHAGYHASLTITDFDDPFLGPVSDSTDPCDPSWGTGPLSHALMYCGLTKGETYFATWDEDFDDFSFTMNRILIDAASPNFAIIDRGTRIDFQCCVDTRRLYLEDGGRWFFSDIYSGGYVAGNYIIATLPEPGTLTAIAAALVAFGLRRRSE